MAVLVPILARLGLALLNEALIKRLIYRLAQELVKLTESTVDDDVVKFIGEAWGLEYPSK
jgi:hypothetical protein